MSPAVSLSRLARRFSLGAAKARRVAHGFSLRLCATAVGRVFPLGNRFLVALNRLPEGSAGLVVFKAASHGKTFSGLVGLFLARGSAPRHHVSFGGATC